MSDIVTGVALYNVVSNKFYCSRSWEQPDMREWSNILGCVFNLLEFNNFFVNLSLDIYTVLRGDNREIVESPDVVKFKDEVFVIPFYEIDIPKTVSEVDFTRYDIIPFREFDVDSHTLAWFNSNGMSGMARITFKWGNQ